VRILHTPRFLGALLWFSLNAEPRRLLRQCSVFFSGHNYSASAPLESMAGLSGGPYSSPYAPALFPRRLLTNIVIADAGSNMSANETAYISSSKTLNSHSAASSSQGFETPRRAQTYGRRPEELHMPSNAATSQQSPKDMPRHHSYHSSHEFAEGAPGINVHQATPQGPQFSNPSAGASLPGSLQPGRPGASVSITAPSTIPTLPQLQSAGQSQNSSRPSTASHAHSYSRSSPAGLDQKYAPFANTPESSKYASPPSHRYTSSQTNQADSLYSPLGLADIRNMDSAEAPQSANPYSNDGFPAFPTNSNYLAPWAVYAFDWCKWPVQQQISGDSAGKMAIGSYVEDGHNFVGAL